MTLSPAQQKMLKIGVPIVAALGLIAFLRSRSAAKTTGALPAGTTAADTSAVDSGQLAAFESAVGAQLSAWELSQMAGSSGTTAVTPATSPSAPAPSSPSSSQPVTSAPAPAPLSATNLAVVDAFASSGTSYTSQPVSLGSGSGALQGTQYTQPNGATITVWGSG